MLATAESCTGGLIAGLITEIPGASDVLERGFVTYSNAAKIGMLGVDFELIQRYGAVSAEVARAMADGALRNSAATVAVSVTGIAGPGGGSAEEAGRPRTFRLFRQGRDPAAHANAVSAIWDGPKCGSLPSRKPSAHRARERGSVDRSDRIGVPVVMRMTA